MSRIWAVVGMGYLVAAGAVQAQTRLGTSDPPGSISTERPAFTDSTTTVPGGYLQIENGFLETKTQGRSGFDLPETLLRLGVTAKTELRLAAPDYCHNGAGAAAGFGDLVLGVKQQLGPAPGGVDAALALSVSLPTGANSVSSRGYDPTVQLACSRTLAGSWTAAGMFSVSWPTQVAMRNVTGQITFTLDRQISRPWDAFIEYAGGFPESGGPQHVLHFGTAYKVASDQQLDLHLGFGLSAAAPDYLIGFGYSIRLKAFGH
ncbi:MAG: transporter [Acidobacteriota bacterium]|nr:transporter [Acidobacteriota bacterium]